MRACFPIIGYGRTKLWAEVNIYVTVTSRIDATVVVTSRSVAAAMSVAADVPLNKFKSATADIAALTILEVMTKAASIHEAPLSR